MRSLLIRLGIISLAVLYTNCANQSGGGSTSVTYNNSQTCTNGGAVNSAAVNSKALTISGSEANSVAITVGCGYVNQPCVSVTICSAGSGGSSNCQTIPNLLLDTGSYGLRIFDNATTTAGTLSTSNLTAVNSLYECVSYVDGSYQWGQVMKADVVLGSKVASSVPIQIIKANPTTSSPTVPTACVNQQGDAGTADTSIPGYYNGILGVGLFAQDCGTNCVTHSNNSLYFSCSGNNCSGSIASLANQVTNPVAMMPTGFNNGIAVQLNNVPDGGAVSSSGYMVLGIGTASNNTPPGSVVTYPADSNGNFQTKFGGVNYTTSFIDSGSNGLFFPNGCLAVDSSGFFIPTNELGFTATQLSASGTNSTTITFNSAAPTSTTNMVFNNLTGDASGFFDWGLPFFLGRTVYVGIQNKSSTLGTGPYWAY